MTLELIEGGACGIHYYTFNLERSTRLILEGAGLVNKTDYIKKNMPWRSVRFFFTFVCLESNVQILTSKEK